MSERAAPVRPLDDALLALRLFLNAPATLRGVCLRGGGPARDLMLEAMKHTGIQMRRLPLHIDNERLLGGVDIAASLAAGSTIRQCGLLEEIADGVLVAPLAERMPDSLAGKLVQAMDTAPHDSRFGIVLLDDGIESDDTPPPSLLERIAFICDLSMAESLDFAQIRADVPVQAADVVPFTEDELASIAATAAALGVGSARQLLFAAETARLHAALHGRTEAIAADFEAAARLVLAPRATQLPPSEFDSERQQPEDARQPDDDGNQSGPVEHPLEDVVLEAAVTAIPTDLLAQLSSRKANRNAQGSGGGRRRKSTLRGKPLGARPGMPGGGARLALIDTLRAAVPWQQLRSRETSGESPIIIAKDDLRIRRFEERAVKLTIFCVDASGSAAAARLAEAKGAIELMLAQAYATRSEVALVAFRGSSAELILPPTRSLTRARRALAELPGGGGTPLALGLRVGREVAEAGEMRGRTPHLVVLTDGRGNIAADGSASRSRAAQDVETAAKAISACGIETLVIDISVRAGQDALRLAQLMQARFLAMPMANARKLHAAVTAITPQRAA